VSANHERIARAVDDAGLLVWEWDRGRGVTLFGEREVSMLGYSAAELAPEVAAWARLFEENAASSAPFEGWTGEDGPAPLQSLDGLVHPDDRRTLARTLIEATRGPTSLFEVEARVFARSGEWRWILIQGRTATRDADGRPRRACGVLLDVHERKHAELAESRRVREDFLGTLSHELRSPLTAAISTAESLRRSFYGELTPEQARRVEAIERNGWQMSRMITEIFDMLKLQFADVRLAEDDVPVMDVCRESLATIADEAAAAGIKVRLSIDAASLAVRADRRRLVQALSALLRNAVKYTPPGKAMGLSFARPEGGALPSFTVWDEGPGFDPATAEQLFEPYAQDESGLARHSSGLGLGLALARAIARHHGGNVVASLRAEEGSSFRLTLPATRLCAGEAPPRSATPAPTRTPPRPEDASRTTTRAAAAASDAPPPFQASEPAKGAPRILVVDDRAANRDLLVAILGYAGYRVETAESGTEGIDAALAAPPDAILMDVMMPGVDGITAIRRLRAEASTANVPIIAVTASGRPAEREFCLEAGADDFLAKPFQAAELETMLARVLDGAGTDRTR